MLRTLYVNISEINGLQTRIMQYVGYWVREERTPVPQQEIIKNMKVSGVKVFTTVNALNALLRKGYLRRACTISNKTFYVALRSV